MVKKIKKYLKFMVCCALIMSLVAPSYAALSASDGSAFVTKAEFDSALADFNARLTTFEAGINSKIDSQVTSYLDRNGIWNGKDWDLNPSGREFWSTSGTSTASSTLVYGSSASGYGVLFCCDQTFTDPAALGSSSTSYCRRGIAWVASDAPKSGLCVVDFNLGCFYQNSNYVNYSNAENKRKTLGDLNTGYTYSQWQTLWMGTPGSGSTTRNFVSSNTDMGAAAVGTVEFYKSTTPFKWLTNNTLAKDPYHSNLSSPDAGGTNVTIGYSSSYNTKFLNACECVYTLPFGSMASFYGSAKWNMLYCGYCTLRGVAQFFVTKGDNLGYWSGANMGVYSGTPQQGSQGWFDGYYGDRQFVLSIY